MIQPWEQYGHDHLNEVELAKRVNDLFLTATFFRRESDKILKQAYSARELLLIRRKDRQSQTATTLQTAGE